MTSNSLAKKRQILKKIIAVIIIVAVFSFLGKVLYQNWTKVPFEKLEFNYIFLTLSFVFLFFCFLLGSFIWKLILRSMGESITLKKSMGIIAVSQLGRYIPGKVWTFFGRMYLAKREGIPERKTATSMLLETGLLVISAAIIFLIAFGFCKGTVLPNKVYWALFLIPAGLIVLYPPIFTSIINFFLKRLKREVIDIKIRYIEILGLLILYCFVWLFQGIGFYFLIKSFYPVEFASFLPLMGTYTISWVIGFLSLITPGGLGVREGIMGFLLKFYLPVSIAIIATLLARIWITIGELIFFGIFARGARKVES